MFKNKSDLLILTVGLLFTGSLIQICNAVTQCVYGMSINGVELLVNGSCFSAYSAACIRYSGTLSGNTIEYYDCTASCVNNGNGYYTFNFNGNTYANIYATTHCCFTDSCMDFSRAQYFKSKKFISIIPFLLFSVNFNLILK